MLFKTRLRQLVLDSIYGADKYGSLCFFVRFVSANA